MEGAERGFFSDVAQNYDKLSRALTAGLDNFWRRRAVDLVGGLGKARVLDVATGTGNIAIMIAKRYQEYGVTGIDLNSQMLSIAKKKAKGISNLRFVNGDIESIRMKSGSFDIVISSFALSAFEDLPKAIASMYRVLRPGGTLILLDVNKRRNKIFTSLLGAYQMLSVAPTFSGELRREVNMYIHSKRFKIDRQELTRILEEAGFKLVEARDLSFRTVFIIKCSK
ncbi:MAG: class I SAM-dependent methyltransferase [Candidatus Micrarchaeota archaeon]|nr:class I SAM-dependent methyltransferase [Candidatus Micrarchaeota archaeon]